MFYEGEINRTQGTQFGDCIAKIGYLAQRTIAEPQNFRGVRDVQGRLQAGAIVLGDGGYLYQSAEYREYLYLDTLSNAPWNVIKNQPETVTGAATCLVEEIVKESIQLEYDGIVKTLAIKRAKPFYTRVGFIENPDISGEMVLNEQAASRFLLEQQRRHSLEG